MEGTRKNKEKDTMKNTRRMDGRILDAVEERIANRILSRIMGDHDDDNDDPPKRRRSFSREGRRRRRERSSDSREGDRRRPLTSTRSKRLRSRAPTPDRKEDQGYVRSRWRGKISRRKGERGGSPQSSGRFDTQTNVQSTRGVSNKEGSRTRLARSRSVRKARGAHDVTPGPLWDHAEAGWGGGHWSDRWSSSER